MKIELASTQLFRGLNENEITSMLKCLNAHEKSYQKGEIIMSEGSFVSEIGIILSGSVTVEFCDIWGNNNIVRALEPGMSFAEEYACGARNPIIVSIKADTDTTIMFLRASRIMHPCVKNCNCHEKLMANLLFVSVSRSLHLLRKILHSSPKTIRGRLISYFSECIKIHGSTSFEIPFNRQQLADYLNTDRSAMCNELSKMQKEGILQYSKTHFVINKILDDF